jgi:arylsulfatase A-like enzyme
LSKRPNIVLILADDLGYGSLSAYGEKEIPTPNIDSLAKNGAKMTDGYVSCPICAPTRAGLMTGRYQQRFGFEHNPGPDRQASPRFGLPADETTMAEVLSKNGYRTGMVGKWHLGYKEGRLPTDRGFQSFYGFLSGANNYLPGPRFDNILRGKETVKETEYLTDAMARESVDFIKKDDKRPFFLYLAFNAVHAPMEAPSKYTDPFTELTGTRKTFAGMQTAMDTAVGRVLTSLRVKKIEDNTVVFFLSDNGGPTQQTTSKNCPLRGVKGQVYEGGIRVPFMVQWKGEVKPGTLVQDPCFSLDIFPTILEIAGIPKEKAKEGLEGTSLLPLLQGSSSKAAPRAIFWRMGPQHAVRYGDWKLIVRRGAFPELYNLKDDIAESKNLAESKPDKLAELQKLYTEWDKKNTAPLWRRSEGGE